MEGVGFDLAILEWVLALPTADVLAGSDSSANVSDDSCTEGTGKTSTNQRPPLMLKEGFARKCAFSWPKL